MKGNGNALEIYFGVQLTRNADSFEVRSSEKGGTRIILFFSPFHGNFYSENFNNADITFKQLI